jgi:hypothetical protein
MNQKILMIMQERNIMPKTNDNIRKKIQQEITHCLDSLNIIYELIDILDQSYSEDLKEKKGNTPKRKRKKLTETDIEKIITSLKIRGLKLTKTNILNELSLFGFGKTDQNYKLICFKVEQIKSLINC